jgi:hypothetical protein
MTRPCRKCRNAHPVFYMVHKNESRHLVMICGNQWTYVPFEDGLDIEVRYSKNYQRIEAMHEELDRQCDEARDRDRRGE